MIEKTKMNVFTATPKRDLYFMVQSKRMGLCDLTLIVLSTEPENNRPLDIAKHVTLLS